jgi:hypothetical protein
MTVHYSWNHAWATGDSNGLAIIGAGDTGKHTIGVGGYVGGPACNTATPPAVETDGSGLNAFYPLVGTWITHDIGTNSDLGSAAFAVPPGVTVRVHVWNTWVD